MNVTFFDSQAHFHRWLERHHATDAELWIGFNKVGSGLGGITYQQALDEALCFGWIDGLRKRLDDDRFTIRFSPRKPKSIWSAVNIRRMAELDKLGVIQPPGRRAFEAREAKRPGTYSYENRPRELEGEYARLFTASTKAWAFFQAQPPSYRRMMVWRVMSAVKDETRMSRLVQLITWCEQGVRIDPMKPASTRPGAAAATKTGTAATSATGAKKTKAKTSIAKKTSTQPTRAKQPKPAKQTTRKKGN